MNKPIKLKCHVCGYEWKYRGKMSRAQCSMCRSKNKKIVYVKTGIATTNAPIQEKILNGSILKTMDKMGINPLKKTSLGDCIIHVLNDDALILALNKASRKTKKKPVVLIREAVNLFLKQEGFL